MTHLADIRARTTWRDVIEGQPQHLGLIVLLWAGASGLMVPSDSLHRFLGFTAPQWATMSIALAVVHQVLVAGAFRTQLHHNLLSRLWGEDDIRIWTRIFLPLLIARPVSVILTGWADDVPIGLPRWIEIGVGVVLVGLAIYGMQSVLRHFTIRRAVGGDHFRDDIAALPLVVEGIFKYTQNAMYGVIFLGLWGIALLFGSWNALVLALFQHVYIWVHMYCTEKPDMAWIYGNR